MAEPILSERQIKGSTVGKLHALIEHECPSCKKKMRGNVFFRHLAACTGIPPRRQRSISKKGTCVHCGAETCLARITCCISCRDKKRETPLSIKRKEHRVCQTCGKPTGYFNWTYCSFACKKWNPQESQYVRDHYPSEGAVAVAEHLGKTVRSVQNHVHRLGLKSTDLWIRKQHGLTNPNRLERKLYAILDSLHVPYERQYRVKDKFLVDAKVGESLVIEADGEYWHGHPRFSPLSDQQLRQQKRDAARNKYLQTIGYTVERIWEHELNLLTVTAVLERNGFNLFRQRHR